MKNPRKTEGLYEAGNRARTDDLLITNQLLYQLSYSGLLEPSNDPWGRSSTLLRELR